MTSFLRGTIREGTNQQRFVREEIVQEGIVRVWTFFGSEMSGGCCPWGNCPCGGVVRGGSIRGGIYLEPYSQTTLLDTCTPAQTVHVIERNWPILTPWALHSPAEFSPLCGYTKARIGPNCTPSH